MKLLEITQSDAWEAFQASQPYAQFLQSWAWGEFRTSEGGRVRRFALADAKGAWSIAAQMEYRQRKFGTGYWFAARGPVFSSSVPEADRAELMLEFCTKLCELSDLRRRTLFWRMEPVSRVSQPEGLVPLSFFRTHALNPASTIIANLTPSEDVLLQRMHEKTRYNIRLAERNGVRVRVGTGSGDLDAFLRLMEETASRDGFVQHASAYLGRTHQFLAARGMSTIRVAEHEGKILAANMEITFGDTVTYLYGSSSSASRNVMAPYALHWNAMRDAKTRGFSRYDFWGANPEFKGSFYYKNAWEGITRFKRGFCGEQVDLVGTWDLPFNRTLYRLIHLDQFFRG